VIPTYRISAARVEDLSRLSAIELAAARLLEGHAPESGAERDDEPDLLKRAQREGRLWVGLADDVSVGFAHVEVIEPGAAHLEEIDVHPDHGRRGLAAKLIRQVCE
jgi:ribosomal protein S18 acetylase RimI-like enzyme